MEKQDFDMEKIVDQLNIDDEPKGNHKDRLRWDVLKAFNSSNDAIQDVKYKWSFIMNNKITKFAAATIVIIAIGLSFTFMEKTTGPAWAIEQVIESMANYRGIKMFSTTLDKSGTKISSVLWATPNEDFTQSDQFKLELENGVIRWVKGNDTYHYEPSESKVYVMRGSKMSISPWIGPKLIETLSQTTENWQEHFGIDPSTGRQRVYVTCSHPHAPGPRSWWFEFDVETNLPVRFKQWTNEGGEDQPQFNVTEIVFYEELAENTFDVQIPESAVWEEKLQFSFPVVEDVQVFGSQIDEWHIKASGQIEAHSFIDLMKTPPDNLLKIRLPYFEGFLESVKADGVIGFDNIGNGKYKIYLTKDFDKDNTIECVWTVSMEHLEKDKYGYRAILKSLMPVNYYRLYVVLEPDCGYVNNMDPSNKQPLRFSWRDDDPVMEFGSCGIPIQQE